MAEKLNAGDGFPRIALRLADGGTLTLPDEIGAAYAVVIFYRGHW